MLFPPVAAITKNPLETRSDLVVLLLTLATPLLGAQSSGGARVCLSGGAAGFDQAAAELEGYARVLWGLAPLLAVEPDHPQFRSFRQRWVEGLSAGTDKAHADYWGEAGDKDQRFVEMGAIAYAIILAPRVFWTPLNLPTQTNVTRWLLTINEHTLPVSNWRFFRILANLALKLVGCEYSQHMIDQDMTIVDTFYGKHGFPSDGANAACQSYDYYATSFAIPFYSLIYATYDNNTGTTIKLKHRARMNIIPLINLFAPDGSCIPFGRSMTYRFACSSFFAAVAFSELDLPIGLTWGHIKGLLLRNIRWFTHRSKLFARDGSLTIGYAYPSQFISEDYNSPQSPYWALKSFLVLALPSSHPFWQAKEETYPVHLFDTTVRVIRPWGQVFTHAAGHTFCLTAGQQVRFDMRHSAAKYGKMAYSAQFGFSVPTGAFGLKEHAPDSVLALSDDGGETWKVRRIAEEVQISPSGMIRSVWRPWPGVHVLTWLIPPSTLDSPYHTRIHLIKRPSGRKLLAADSGFSIDSQTGPARCQRHLNRISKIAQPLAHGRYEAEKGGAAVAVSPAGMSGVVNLLKGGRAIIQDVDANSNLISERTVMPVVLTDVARESTWLATRIFAKPARDGVYDQREEDLIASWNTCEADTGTELAGIKLEMVD